MAIKSVSDLQYYVDCGFVGLLPEGVWDGGSSKVQWDMNTLTFWLYSKLSWNPYEDVDSLIRYFCDRVYGNASEDMQEYYSLIYKGWIEGESEVQLWNYKHKADYYLDYFVYSTDLETEIIAALRNAYDSADDAAKERIRYIKESYEAAFPEE